MMTFSIILIQLLHITTSLPWSCPADSTACLKGDKHKKHASPEDSTYAACLNYQESSCCTAEFTQQLAQSSVTHIQDGDSIFNWTHCGGMSAECEQYFIEIECLYRCDPNMIYFAGAYNASLDRVPICGQYCDHWYEACKDELSCVTNWIFDWNYTTDGSTQCPTTSTCQPFSSRYADGEELCNVLWGNTFNYTAEQDLCFEPNRYQVNTLVTEEIFSEQCSETRTIESPDTIYWDCPADTSICLESEGKHKITPSAEDESYAACLNYKDLSCCSAEFTQQLAASTVTHIQDGNSIFNWTHCGPISTECEDYFIEIECMYRCDPNMIYFAGVWPGSLNRVPICGQYCDHWYEACKTDLACVTNWVTDWDYTTDGSTRCPSSETCLTFEERYANGTQLCNVLWGWSFDYTAEKDLCLTPNANAANTLVVDTLFSTKCPPTTSPTSVPSISPEMGTSTPTATPIKDGNSTPSLVVYINIMVGYIVFFVLLLC